MNGIISFAGKDLNEFGVFCDGSLMFVKPQKNVEHFSIVGRNGDLTISNERFENVNITIPCFIRKGFRPAFTALIDFLSSTEGYQRLETYEQPNAYRMAEFVEAVNPNTGAWMHYGSFELVFNCKPQIWLFEGENEITITNGDILRNPTQKPSKPLIKVVGTGSITIGDKILTLNANTGTTFIDCDIQDAYQGTINRNGNLIIETSFPVLDIGDTKINYSGFNNVVIVPRWWHL